MKGDGKNYDKELFEFDTQTRQELYNLDSGFLPDRGEVTFDPSVHDGHDYRYLKYALEDEEVKAKKPHESEETRLSVASSSQFRDKVISAIERYGTLEPQDYNNDPESLLIFQEQELKESLIKTGIPDLLLSLKQAKTVSEAKQARNRLRWAIDYEFSRQKKEIDTVNQIFEERVAEIKKEHQKVGLLKFNEKIIREVKQEMRQLSKANDKTLRLWRSRLENLKMPGNSSESQWITEWRTRQLENINNSLRKLDEKLTPQHERQEEKEKMHLESRKLAKEMVGYLKEMAEAGKAVKPLQDQLSKNKRKVDWKMLKQLNADTYEASFGQIVFFQYLRKTNPDLMLRLYPKIAHLDRNSKEDYNKALEDFVSTHNSFNWSKEAMRECEKRNPSLARRLKKILQNRPEEDQEFEFHQLRTGLPNKVLKRLYAPVN